MRFCCEDMRRADQDGAIDYFDDHLTTIDTKKNAWVVRYCPFCGKKLKGTVKATRVIKQDIFEKKPIKV